MSNSKVIETRKFGTQFPIYTVCLSKPHDLWAPNAIDSTDMTAWMFTGMNELTLDFGSNSINISKLYIRISNSSWHDIVFSLSIEGLKNNVLTTIFPSYQITVKPTATPTPLNPTPIIVTSDSYSLIKLNINSSGLLGLHDIRYEG